MHTNEQPAPGPRLAPHVSRLTSRDAGRPGRRARRPARGFSLIELMVVITIIGLLAGVVGLRLFGVVGEGRQVRARADIKQISSGLQMYRFKKGKYPAELRELLEPITQADTEGILDSLPKDPWGNDYHYTRQDKSFKLESWGANNASGGEGEDADISNQEDTQPK